VPAYFEWWYFHFVTEDGVALNIVVHETDIFGHKQKPYISLSALVPGDEPHYLRRDLDAAIAAGKGSYLRVGEEMIVESDRRICLDITFPTRSYFRGEITKLVPPLAIREGILFEDPNTGRASHWLAQVPHATFTGILQLDGTVRRLSGTAYQDHQWGTILIQEFVSDWVWGHFSNDRVAVVFFQILTQHGRLIERIAMVTEDGRFTGTILKTNYLDTLFPADHPEKFNDVVSVSFLNCQFEVAFDLSRSNLMRSRLGEVQDQVSASYLRWSAASTLQNGCGPQPLHGISEYIRIRPAMYGELSN
jgi:hypothetical protein